MHNKVCYLLLNLCLSKNRAKVRRQMLKNGKGDL
jgi:hypothetical protein